MLNIKLIIIIKLLFNIIPSFLSKSYPYFLEQIACKNYLHIKIFNS